MTNNSLRMHHNKIDNSFEHVTAWLTIALLYVTVRLTIVFEYVTAWLTIILKHFTALLTVVLEQITTRLISLWAWHCLSNNSHCKIDTVLEHLLHCMIGKGLWKHHCKTDKVNISRSDWQSFEHITVKLTEWTYHCKTDIGLWTHHCETDNCL